MTYYIQLIQEFLTANGYANVFYDYDNPKFEERIFIENVGGLAVEPNQPVLYRDFAVYVRRNKRATARNVTETIFTLLNGNNIAQSGILKIECITPPTVYTIEPTTGNQSEYIIQFRCMIVDNSQNRIY